MQYFTILISLLLSFGLAAQDWHPFPLDMKKEYNMSENYNSSYLSVGDNYHSYYVDSIEVVDGFEKLIVGGKYFFEPFDSCSYLVEAPELYTFLDDDDWFCSDDINGVAIYRWSRINGRYDKLSDVYYLENSQLTYLIEGNSIVLDTIRISLDLSAEEKDTFYFQNHPLIEYVEVTCVSEGFGEVMEGLEDDYKVFEFKAFDDLGSPISDYNNGQFVLTKNAGLIDFFRFEGFYDLDDFSPMKAEGIRVDNTYYGLKYDADLYLDPIQVGSIYKWKVRGTTTNSTSYFKGFARDSLVAIDGNDFHFIRDERLLLFTQNSSGDVDSTAINTIENHIEEMPTYQLDSQVDLNHGYYTQVDTLEVSPGGVGIKKIDGVYYTRSLKWDGSLGGAQILPGGCCVSFGFNEGDNNTLSQTYEYSSLTGFHFYQYIDSPSTDITYTLIGFESPDTLIGDASPLATQDIIKTQQAQLTLYPNPTNEELTLEVPSKFLSADNATVQIFNIQGQLISEQTMLLNESNQLNTSDLSTGLYTLFVKTEKGILTEKFVRE